VLYGIIPPCKESGHFSGHYAVVFKIYYQNAYYRSQKERFSPLEWVHQKSRYLHFFNLLDGIAGEKQRTKNKTDC
jgi:hypothetical protein